MRCEQFVCSPESAESWAKDLTLCGFNVETFRESQAAINFAERHLGPISGENPTYFGHNLGGILEKNGVCASLHIWRGQQWASRQPATLCWAGLSLLPRPRLWIGRTQRKFLREVCGQLATLGFRPIDGQESDEINS